MATISPPEVPAHGKRENHLIGICHKINVIFLMSKLLIYLHVTLGLMPL